MLTRPERVDDVEAIAAVLTDAFRRPGSDEAPPEVGLVSTLRGSDAWIPQQSQVADDGDLVIGHCLCTRAYVDSTPVLALGPIAVTPGRQGQGVGSALMRNAIEIATEVGEQLIGLLGDPSYYGRFGFVPSDEEDIESPDLAWGRYFQVLKLPGFRGASGRFAYPEPFRQVS